MTDKTPRPHDESRLLSGELLDGLTRLALQSPEEAIPALQPFDQSLRDSGGTDIGAVRFLYFLAYASLAGGKYEANANEPNDEIIELCERAIGEYRRALRLSQFDTTETYQEEVIVKPATLFRKAQTELQTRTRTVTKNSLDRRPAVGPLDLVLTILEKASPGRVHELLGEVKVKYLVLADRLYCAPNVQTALEQGILSREDMAAISEFTLQGNGPVRCAMMTGGYGSMLIAGYDSPDGPNGARQTTDILTLLKKDRTWVKEEKNHQLQHQS